MYRPELKILTAPGRTELCGNHTDHQNGTVLAAAVDLATSAVVVKNNDSKVNIISQGFGFSCVDLADTRIRPEEFGSSAALIRGVAAGFKAIGCAVGGFDALVSSRVLPGSGLSSSAAFEVLIARIFNALFNNDEVGDLVIARIARLAENYWFGKPCGPMDQTVSSVGGLACIDFKNPDRPAVEKLYTDVSDFDHSICLISTGASHAGFTDAYASIPEDMSAVAAVFGKKVLRDVDEIDFFSHIDACGQRTGGMATLRAIHFFLEENRVREAVFALKCGDFPCFLEVLNESGRSSGKLLKNLCVPGSGDPGLAPALALSRRVLSGAGATRPHGGGFAGTIQAIVPNEMLGEYRSAMEAVYGPGSCRQLAISEAEEKE